MLSKRNYILAGSVNLTSEGIKNIQPIFRLIFHGVESKLKHGMSFIINGVDELFINASIEMIAKDMSENYQRHNQ